MSAHLLYTDVEEALRKSVRTLLDNRAPWHVVLARTESATTTDLGLWQALGTDLGCAALAVPEELGGAGATWREAAVVAEELGRAVAPLPFLGSAIVTALLLSLEETGLLAKLVAEGATATVAVPFSAMPGDRVGGLELRGGRLHGEVRAVADAGAADHLLAPAGDVLVHVDTTTPGVVSTPVVCLDMTRQLVDLSFQGAPVVELHRGGAAMAAVDDALRLGTVLLASEQLGLAQRCLDLTLDHVKTRHQFGRAVGSYQAIKHRLADLWVRVTQARAVARYAADCAATASPDLPVAAALAKAHCSLVAQRAAEECVQLHGGIGFTWEHPAHLYLKRAKSSAIALGTAQRHHAALAELVDIAGPGPRSSHE